MEKEGSVREDGEKEGKMRTGFAASNTDALEGKF
jgi:hypothetical protein